MDNGDDELTAISCFLQKFLLQALVQLCQIIFILLNIFLHDASAWLAQEVQDTQLPDCIWLPQPNH